MWFKLDADLKDHPKRYALEGKLGEKIGVQVVVMLYCFALKYAPTGDITDYRDDVIERFCEWEGEAGHLVRSFIETGFIDNIENRKVIHGWEEKQSYYIQQRRKGNSQHSLKKTLPRGEEKRVEKKHISATADDLFSSFWGAYPRKVSKGSAIKAWQKLTQEEKGAAVAAIPLHAKRWEEQKTDPNYIPHAATWIRAQKWTDELEKKTDISTQRFC